MAAFALAIALGLCGGYLDVLAIVFKKYGWNEGRSFRTARDFLWTVPVGHAVLLLIPGLLVAGLNRLRPGLIPLRVGAWLFATLALWGALLRMPIYGACGLILAAGLGRPISAAIAGWARPSGSTRLALGGLLGLLGVLAALSSGWQAIRESRAVAALPPPPPGARNVVLIVWDTVRASDLSLGRYSRDTTPNLAHWARLGVRYDRALAPAPWTFPSHGCFFTGRWPFQLDTSWKFALDTPDPTLAEYLAARGYQTAGFAANTNWCHHETGLARGFAHYEDHPLTPRSLLSRTVPGAWLLKEALGHLGDYYQLKWADLESRDARGINEAFLAWLQGRRPDRPFLAFLNYFDAHEPYVPPPAYQYHFGIRPRSSRDFETLLNFRGVDKRSIPLRDTLMARDCYDDCIAYLDGQLGLLLEELHGRGLLENTMVIITSDHGEAFGDHGVFGHGYDLHLEEIGVPLVILSPGAPAGRVVGASVSLRDLPATVVDQLGLSGGSPFPGRSLAGYWEPAAGSEAPGITTPAFSEQTNAATLPFSPRSGPEYGGFQMSLVALGWHYIRNGRGAEGLYDLRLDPSELVNLANAPHGRQAVGVFRRMLLELLTENPGSPRAEDAYLGALRRDLRSLVPESTPSRLTDHP